MSSSTGQEAVTPVGRRDAGRGAPAAPDAPRSYYGKPIIAEPVWKGEIPFYFFFGGLGGASATLALGAELAGRERLARRAWLTALGAAGVASPALLISDLGKPARFYNMLRLFKITSPMSVGSWVLLATGAGVAAASARSVLGILPRLGRVGGALAGGALGPALSTYTAVLISDTAVPVWHEARMSLPLVFAGGSLASAGAAASILNAPVEAAPARRLTVAGAALSELAMRVMQRRLGELGEPYRQGSTGTLSKLAQGLTGAGAVVVALVGRRRAAAAVGGALVLAGAACERWAIFRAGFDSARDPKYVVGPQRRRLQARAGRPTSL